MKVDSLNIEQAIELLETGEYTADKFSVAHGRTDKYTEEFSLSMKQTREDVPFLKFCKAIQRFKQENIYIYCRFKAKRHRLYDDPTLTYRYGSEKLIIYPRKIVDYVKFHEHDGFMTPYIDRETMFKRMIMEYLEENGTMTLSVAKDIEEKVQGYIFYLVDISEDLDPEQAPIVEKVQKENVC